MNREYSENRPLSSTTKHKKVAVARLSTLQRPLSLIFKPMNFLFIRERLHDRNCTF